MALLAEEIVQEWLNRQGYFTIRGIRIGNSEVDLLAVKVNEDRTIHRRHIEVQASVNPIGYLSTGNAKRMDKDELDNATKKWITKKFGDPRKQELFATLAGDPWTRELVCNKLSYDQQERYALSENGITIIDLKTVIEELKTKKTIVRKASGADLVDLVNFTC